MHVMVDRSITAIVAEVCAAARQVHGEVGEVVEALVDRVAPLLEPDHRATAVAMAVARLSGLDALDLYLRDPKVDEVMVNAGRQIWIDRDGALTHVGELSDADLAALLERVLAATGRRLDRANPIVDVRLADGSRLCAIDAAVAIDGTAVAIRRHRRQPIALEAFDVPAAGLELLAEIVASRCNLVVAGATSAGKTSFVAALLELVGGAERLVVCEDTAELALPHHNAVRLEARPRNADGLAAVDLATLVRAALRLRPDRLVVGEFRGPEVLAMVEAMNTGHDGSVSTCHANSALDALRRIETLVMQAAPMWPLAAIRRQVSRSIDVIVQLGRDRAGGRRVAEIVEVVEGDEPNVRPLLQAGHPASALRRHRQRGVWAGPT